MTYKAQLVVRARGKEGAAIIEKVKEMAGEQGKTYSEMAVELLGRGLNADDTVDTNFGVSSDDDDDAESDDDTGGSDGAGDESEDDPRAPLPPEEAGPAVDPSQPPKTIVKHYLERREDRGERAAARILVDFFDEAGPVEGGELKKLLQEEFSADEFDDLMAPIKRTAEYKEYTRRVISKPSPYSEAR